MALEPARSMALDEWSFRWQFLAACRGEESSLFFAPCSTEAKEEREVREAQAKAICARCRVRPECLEYALRTREPYGIWGGLNEAERRAILRSRDTERAAG